MTRDSVLVTSGSGFIGRWTLEPWAHYGFDVHIAVRRASTCGIGQFHSLNLLDADESEQLSRTCDQRIFCIGRGT